MAVKSKNGGESGFPEDNGITQKKEGFGFTSCMEAGKKRANVGQEAAEIGVGGNGIDGGEAVFAADGEIADLLGQWAVLETHDGSKNSHFEFVHGHTVILERIGRRHVESCAEEAVGGHIEALQVGVIALQQTEFGAVVLIETEDL